VDKPIPKLTNKEVEYLKDFIAKDKKNTDPRLTHEAIQQIFDIIDYQPMLQENLATILMHFRAHQELLIEKNVVTKEDYDKKLKQIVSEYSLPLNQKSMKELNELVKEATDSYIR
jgi:uncharacterized protein (DUF927 family)